MMTRFVSLISDNCLFVEHLEIGATLHLQFIFYIVDLMCVFDTVNSTCSLSNGMEIELSYCYPIRSLVYCK